MSEQYLSTIPAVIKESDSNIISFIRAYYNWLENNQVVFDYVHKEERTSLQDSEFRKFLKDELLNNFPDLVVDETLILQHIKEFYTSKGTEKSIQFLLKILYGVNTEVSYPGDTLFAPSSAKWYRERALRFKLTSGQVSTNEEPLLLTSLTDHIEVNSYFIRPQIDDIYEVVLDIQINLDISKQYTISSSSFSGVVIPVITGKQIINKGSGFKVGDIYEISTSSGSGTQIKITRVDKTGVKGFDIIKFGNGYVTDFNFLLTPSTQIGSITEQRNLSLNLNGQETQLTSPDVINKLADDYKVLKFTYLESLNYLEDNAYVGELLKTGQTEIQGNKIQSSNADAEILFTLGYVFEYPGYYLTNNGIPSDTSRLQDGEYWQQFSYTIKSTKQYREYEKVVKKLVHPAGLRMFGEYDITNKLDILLDIETYLDTFNSILVDSSLIDDQIERKEFVKNILYDEYLLSVDNGYETLQVNSSDEINAGPGFEKFSVLEQIVNTLEKGQIEENQNVSDVLTNRLSKAISELFTAADALYTNVTKVLTHSAFIFDNEQSRTLTKNIKLIKEYLIPYDYSDLLLEHIYNTEQILMFDSGDALDLGDGSTLSTYSGFYTLPDTPIHLITEPNNVLISDEEEEESFIVRNIGGVILNPYYSSNDLINNTIPYWQYGYTINERIIQ